MELQRKNITLETSNFLMPEKSEKAAKSKPKEDQKKLRYNAFCYDRN